MDDNDSLLHFNGINGDTGEYDLPPLSNEELVGLITGGNGPENLSELRFRYRSASAQHWGVKAGIDTRKLDQTGWGVIFPAKGDPAVQEALQPLLDLRKQQAGDTFRVYSGPDGYRPNETKGKWLARHGAGPGPANPDKVPYYLLIVGDPATIPFRFQSQLDVQYAVGRIHFETLTEYANYAQSVVTSESGKVKLPRQMTFFGVANSDDRATQLSADNLLTPLYNGLQAYAQEKKSGWQFDTVMRAAATKSQLSRILGGAATPALLFAASHGMAFSNGAARQQAHQGALLCQDWPGPRLWRNSPIPQDFYYAGDDLAADASLLGLMAFFFACYGAGTPENDEFSKQAFKAREAIAPQPFLAHLPQKMLGHPRGGALAVIGHVERAWGYSFSWPGAGTQTTVFESTLQQLLEGYPVGAALEFFNERYAELATVLSDELEEIDAGKKADPYELPGLWTANNDARGYTILGDPAVRLPVAEADAEASSRNRPVIVLQPTRPATEARPSTPFSAPADAPAAVLTVTTRHGSTRIVTRLAPDGDVETAVEEGTPTAELVALHQAALHEAAALRRATQENARE